MTIALIMLCLAQAALNCWMWERLHQTEHMLEDMLRNRQRRLDQLERRRERV